MISGKQKDKQNNKQTYRHKDIQELKITNRQTSSWKENTLKVCLRLSREEVIDSNKSA
jgi:hypothetical protein